MKRDYSKQTRLRLDYTARINNVVDFIQANLKSQFTLEQLASQANFSKFHFHRIFGSIMGETLNHFIQRVRVEKAAALLISNTKISITEVLLECGFSNSAHFSRVFKERFKVTPSKWRELGNEERKKIISNSKINQSDSNTGKEFEIFSYYVNGASYKQQWRILMTNKKKANVEVKNLPEMTVAYLRHIGPYAANEKLFESLFEKLMKWVGPRDLINFPETQFLTIYHDDPEITDETKLRMDVCLTVPPDTKVDGEIGKTIIPAGKYAVARFEINADEFGEAWSAVMGGWLPESGYQCDDRPTFELYHNNHNEHPENKHIVDICVPAKPL